MIHDTYPLSRMDDCIDSLGDARVFTTPDTNFGYWQMLVAPEERDKKTFTSHRGAYRYIRMLFGLRNAPASFQRALGIILIGVRWKTCLVYLDNVIIFSKSVKNHVKHLDDALTLLGAVEISLNLKKCEFFQRRVKYLEHVILPRKLAVAKNSTQGIQNAEFPKNLTQLRSFRGACNVYRRFIKSYAKVAYPLAPDDYEGR